MDVRAEGAHDGEDGGPPAVVVDLIDLAHQSRPFLERDLLLPGHLAVDELRDELVFVALAALPGIDGGEGGQVVVLRVVGDHAHVIDGHEGHLLTLHVGDAVGEGEELLVGPAAAALALLVAIHLHLQTFSIVV